METQRNFRNDDTAAKTDKVEHLFFRLPLEIRQHIYAIVFHPRRLIKLASVQFELDPWIASSIYRSKAEKLRERDALTIDRGAENDVESEQSFSDDEPGHVDRFSEAFPYEWRTSMIGVSRAISNETLDILYGQHVFLVDIHGNGHFKSLKFTPTNLRRIRYLRIVARPMGVSYGRPLVFNPDLWLPLLEGLLELCIVAQQPLVASGYYGAPTLEEDLREWCTWLDPILQYFSANIQKTTAVSLDDDNRSETTAMVTRHFGDSYQKVRTDTGDHCFERGRYSRESGYWDSDSRDGCNFADGGFGDDWSD